LKQEIERVQATAKKSEEEMSETFMGELKEIEAKLEAKTEEVAKLTRETHRQAQEVTNAQMKAQAL
jgi:hypothetical protein